MTSDSSINKRLEASQDVAGWKSIIFLPFHLIWQIIITISILYVFAMTTNMVTYDLDNWQLVYTGYFCDCLYLTDVFCSILHHALKSTRKLKNFKTRPWAFIIIDCLSLIPFDILYLTVHFSNNSRSDTTWTYMFLCRNLRIYRIHFYFSQINSMVQSLKYAFLIMFSELVVYGFIVAHVGSCIFQSLKTEEEVMNCPQGRFDCMVLNELEVFALFTGRFIGNERTYDTMRKRLAGSIFFTIANYYQFGVMAPLFIFSCKKRLQMYFEFWNRYKRLRIFISNMIEDEHLKKKTLDEFRTVWTFGKGDIEPEVLKTFPLNLRKNAYSDVYWHAFRHSELFQYVSYGCKRSLALKIVGDFYLPGTFFWDIGENKSSMLYLASGILQVMAEENSKSPIMSFSGGTVLGESSIFFPASSKAILRVATYSEIHVLYAKDFFEVIRHYPADMEIIRKKLRQRLTIGKMTRIRKMEISKEIYDRNKGVGHFLTEEDDSVKWIKTQFRQIAVMQELYNKSLQELGEAKTLSNVTRHLHELKTAIDHTTMYLPLLNLGEEIEVLTDLTCLKTSLPWVIDPTSNFMRLWRTLVLLVILFCSITYPIYLAWWQVIPDWLIHISEFVTAINIVDIFMQLSTAIKTKDLVIVQSGAIFRYRLKRLSFYADLISALPILAFSKKSWIEGVSDEAYFRLSIALPLLKVYYISMFLSEWCETLSGRFSLRIMIKYMFLNCLVVYWSIALFNMADVDCFLYTCTGHGWYNPQLEDSYPQYRTLAAAFFGVDFLIDIPSIVTYTHNYPSGLILWFSLLVMVYTLAEWFGDFNAAYMLEMTQEMKFRTLLHSVITFMNDRNILGRIKKRVLDTLHFQWYYDRGDYITQQRAMLEDASVKLKRDVNKSTIFNVMRSCKMLRYEDEALLWYLCGKCSRLALPSNSIVVTFGTQTMDLYIVYKGYLQLNSFLPRDVVNGIATPILYGPGKILPILIALNQMPSSVTARTITDCELIVLSVEHFLTGLILNNCFKDFIEAIKELDLEPFRQAKLAISKVTDVFEVTPEMHSAPFSKYKCCGWFLRLLLMRRSIRSESNHLARWELFRLLCFTVSAMAWPIVSLIESNFRIYLIYSLLAIDSFGWFDFYIKLHIAFYNEKGVLITHTLLTAWHYITTSFILDVLLFAPYLHSICIIALDPRFQMHYNITIFHCFIRVFCLTRLFVFVVKYERAGSIIPYFKWFGCIILFMVVLNCFILLKLRGELTYTGNPAQPYEVDPDGWLSINEVPHSYRLGHMYLTILYVLVMLISRCYPVMRDFTGEILAYKVAFAMIGILVVFFGNAYFVNRETGAKMNFNIYQHHMKALTHFLKDQRAEDGISTEAIQHFEHEWEKKKGEDPHKVFSRFPNILEEDLMYPIYRRTMRGVPCFANANEAFFRTMSRLFVEVHFRKGSTIMFEKGVHKDIYFVHQGECYVRAGNITLCKGSMLGDIKGIGIMKNRIFARTHIVLLMIKSPEFFVILNNFYRTEVAYNKAVENVQDFIESGYATPAPEPGVTEEEMRDRKEMEKEKMESGFELASEMDLTANVVAEKKTKTKTKLLREIHPHSKASKILRLIFLVDAILTVFVIPLIIGLRLSMVSAEVVIYLMDLVWILKIATTLRTSYIAEDTGNLVTNKKKIFQNYLKKWDGFIVDILSVVPFEVLFDLMDIHFSPWHITYRKYCYSLRLLRLLTLWIKAETEKSKISLSDKTRWFFIVMRQFIAYNFLTVINLLIATDERMMIEDTQLEFSEHMVDALLWSYLSMFSLYSGIGFFIFPPEDFTQVCFQICVALYSLLERSLLTSEVLSIINVGMFMKSEKLFKLQLMEKYFMVRDVSPALRKKLMTYARDLFEHFKAEVEPWFLKNAPYYIRVQIMQDLYMTHLIQCYVFRGLPQDFLKQLAARLERHIYFPGDVIAEKGDVDYCMYFVHEGEVASVEQDPSYAGLDYEAEYFGEDSYFGLEQGIFRAFPHAMTFRAITKADLLSLNFFHWEDLRRAFPEVTKTIYEKLLNA